MKTGDIVKKMRSSGYVILVMAVIFSLAWHIFWLSVIKVVAAPAQSSQVRFSKVSFLGQILAKVGMEVRPQTAERTILEKRYLKAFYRYDKTTGRSEKVYVEKYGRDAGSGREADGRMLYMIGEAVSGAKAEPDQSS